MRFHAHRLRKSILSRIFVVAGLTGFCCAGVVASDDLAWLNDQSRPIGDCPVVIFLDQDELSGEISRVGMVPGLSRAARLRNVSQQLRSYRPATSVTVQAYLEKNSTSEIRRFWIVPAFSAALDRAEILAVAAMPGVRRVMPDLAIEAIAPVDTKTGTDLATSSSNHHQMLNVPYLWNLGLTGVGRVVCSFDTGVEHDHPALSGNWRGNHASLSSSWFSTIDPDALPYDQADHGTHTMGTAVGLSGSDTVGVAPGAEWITAAVIDQGKSLSGTFSDILAAFQWALDPDGNPNTTDDVPDVILNSWGVPANLLGPCDEVFFAAIDNVEAAGIVCVFAAGNEGPDASTLRNPASRASSPLNAFAVGAVDNARVVADFSSRGPGGCGLNAIKPDIMAPGVSVRSAAKDGGYKLMSGTSMAAPYIAGLVALCRQYNPDATVEEIKWALVNSAEDLGPPGQDNSYGYGLPDASRLLDYLADPEIPHFCLASHSVAGDGLAMPGETFDMQITLTRTTGTIERVSGLLTAGGAEFVSVLSDSADFVFGLSGTTSLSTQAYQVRFDDNLVNGQAVTLTLVLRDSFGCEYDSLPFSLACGYAPVGSMGHHQAGSIEFTVSDYGQYGLAPGSIYNVGGLGFRVDGGDNLLYEAGIILGRSSLQLSSSIRGQDGVFVPSDFVPERSLSDEWIGCDQAAHRTARLVDDLSEISIPVAVAQQTSDYAPAGDSGIIILRYRLINTALTTLNDLYFGFLADFDMPGGSETISFDEVTGVLGQYGGTGPAVGVVALGGINSFKSLVNGPAKIGFARPDQYALISTSTDVDTVVCGDLLSIIAGGPYTIVPGDSVEVALALVAAVDPASMYARAIRAAELYRVPTGLEDPVTSLPTGYQLHQNYPNPFNPSTTIAFELPVGGDVSLQVYNLLGQTVRRLQSGWLTAGAYQVQWDARTDSGEDAASGVYFYRLVAGAYSQTRKMMLLR